MNKLVRELREAYGGGFSVVTAKQASQKAEKLTHLGPMLRRLAELSTPVPICPENCASLPFCRALQNEDEGITVTDCSRVRAQANTKITLL
jgi:hypothetical protein